MFSSRSVCWLPELYTHAKMLLGSSKCWLSVEDQNSVYKVAQEEGKRGQVYGMLLWQRQVFVSHVIFRGPYAIHSEKQKALPPPTKSKPCSWSPTFRKIERREFLKSERSYRQWCWIMHKGGKRIAFRCLQVPIRSQWVWGYDANGNHVSHQIIRHVGSYLKFKGLLLSYLLKIYQVTSSVPNSFQKAIQNSSPSIIRNLIPIWYLFFHSFVFDLFIVSALVCPSERVILS